MSDRVAAMMAEIEAKQREVERIIAEETKKNIVPPLIEVLEDCINYQDEVSCLWSVSNALNVTLKEAEAAYQAAHPPAISNAEGHMNGKAIERARHSLGVNPGHNVPPESMERYFKLSVPNLDDYKTVFGNNQKIWFSENSGPYTIFEIWNKAAPLRVKLLEARVFAKCIAAEHAEPNQRLHESTVTSVKAHLVAARTDSEWKIQSFKIIDALTQRVAALEARLDAKETVPLGTPVLGSDPDSGEDSVEDTCEVSSSHETTRRTLFPYW